MTQRSSIPSGQAGAIAAAEATAATLQKELGNQLQALLLFGSLAQNSYQPGHSNVNLLAVVSPETSIHEVRRAFRPVWLKHGPILRQAPMVATSHRLARYCTLRPDFADHLTHHGRQLAGRSTSVMPQLAQASPADLTGALAAQAMAASAALAPNLISPEAAEHALQQLRRLARHLTGKPIKDDATAPALFAQVQVALASRLAALPLARWDAPPSLESPPLLPQLLSIYEETDQVLLILPEMMAGEWRSMDWNEVAGRLAGQYYGLQVATPGQLRLVMAQERAADLRLGRLRHAWGATPLEGLTATTGRIMRSAARLPADTHLSGLPNDYFTSADDEDGRIIHDFQNRLLNIQLQHELLHRMAHMPRSGPPIPLPDRGTPSPQRIQAIFDHLDWWADYYTAQMRQHGV